MKQHLPSVEALTAPDDRRLLTELEICEVLEKLADIRALIDRTDRLLTTVLACGGEAPDVDATLGAFDTRLCRVIASIRRRSGI